MDNAITFVSLVRTVLLAKIFLYSSGETLRRQTALRNARKDSS